MKIITYKAILFFLYLSLTSCFVYRIDVQQGNEITPAVVAQLKKGMIKQQIVEIIGYPLINDPFHKNRWDYFYSIKKGDTGEIEKYTLTLQFINNQLSTVHSSLAQ